MGRISYENYALLARSKTNRAEKAGRYNIQQNALRRVVLDVATKLELRPEHDLLEIGCGTGELLIPISFLVKSVTGVDHPVVLKALESRFSSENLSCVPGNFLDVEIKGRFDRVLVYSVVQLLSDEDELLRFVTKAASLLRPAGSMLIGDFPNLDKKARFLSTEAGRAFEKEWKLELARTGGRDLPDLVPDNQFVRCDDPTLCRMVAHLRKEGLDTYLLPQSPKLPFGRTREDVLATRQA